MTINAGHFAQSVCSATCLVPAFAGADRKGPSRFLGTCGEISDGLALLPLRDSLLADAVAFSERSHALLTILYCSTLRCSRVHARRCASGSLADARELDQRYQAAERHLSRYHNLDDASTVCIRRRPEATAGQGIRLHSAHQPDYHRLTTSCYPRHAFAPCAAVLQVRQNSRRPRRRSRAYTLSTLASIIPKTAGSRKTFGSRANWLSGSR